jgi:hypothetical protein
MQKTFQLLTAHPASLPTPSPFVSVPHTLPPVVQHTKSAASLTIHRTTPRSSTMTFPCLN